MISLFALSCLFGQLVYQVLHDEDVGYYYHTHFPILCKLIEAIRDDIVEFTAPFFEIMPENKYEVAHIYPRLWGLLTQKEKRIADIDRKALALR
jgi:hypothetical protein